MSKKTKRFFCLNELSATDTTALHYKHLAHNTLLSPQNVFIAMTQKLFLGHFYIAHRI